MSLSLLPRELLDHIASYITSVPTLRALACVNLQFNAIFDPLLYQQDARGSPSVAITWAAEHGMIDIIKKSLSYGAEIPLRATIPKFIHGESRVLYGGKSYWHPSARETHPLCLAVRNGHLQIVQFLIARGGDINMTDSQCLSLLCLAVIRGDIHLVKTLLDLGASQSKMLVFYWNSPLQLAAFRGDREMMAVLLHETSEPPTPMQTQEALESALYEGQIHIVQLLLDYGVDVNFRYRYAHVRGLWSPLLYAVEKGNTELVSLLLSAGANPNFPYGEYESALSRAVAMNQEDMVKLLLDGTDKRRRTRALTRSMTYPDGRMAQLLLEKGTATEFEQGDEAEVHESGHSDGCVFTSSPPNQLMPPLFYAVELGHLNLVQLLVAHGANVNVEYEFEEVPVVLAMKLGNKDIADFLRDHGADEDHESNWVTLFRSFENFKYKPI